MERAGDTRRKAYTYSEDVRRTGNLGAPVSFIVRVRRLWFRSCAAFKTHYREGYLASWESGLGLHTKTNAMRFNSLNEACQAVFDLEEGIDASSEKELDVNRQAIHIVLDEREGKVS